MPSLSLANFAIESTVPTTSALSWYLKSRPPLFKRSGNMPSRKPKKLPSDLYEKGKETVKEAQNCPDPEMKKFMLEAARRYYDADIKQNTPLPLWALSIALVVFYLLILGTMVWAFSKLSGWVAAF